MSGPPFSAALSESEAGFRLELLVSAGASAASFPDRFDPWRRRIGIRVRAPADDGRANREVLTLVAAFFDRPSRDVLITRGLSDPQKTVAVRGVALADALRRLEAAEW
jgi:uncharacterized protein